MYQVIPRNSKKIKNLTNIVRFPKKNKNTSPIPKIREFLAQKGMLKTAKF